MTEQEALDLVSTNIAKGWYNKLTPEASKLVRDYYYERLGPLLQQHLATSNETIQVVTQPNSSYQSLVLSIGINRVVIGDYGAYIEMRPDQMVLKNIRPKWPGEPRRPVKYLWMVPIDGSPSKIYEQRGTVSYADYRVGMYYVAPSQVNIAVL